MSEILDPVVPHGWTWQPLDSLATVLVSTVDKKSYEGELPVRLCNYTDVYYNDEITAGMDFMHATATPSQLLRFGVKAGDVVITKDSETSDDIGRPAYIPKDLNGVVYGYHLAIYTPFDLRYGKFIRYIFDSAWVRAQLHVRTPGVTRVGLNQDTLKNLKIPVPSPSLAVKIADFLDRETAEIDAFIADQERLIELLEERRAATITHAVTKGLDPTVPMKDSGIEWLGETPVSWKIAKLRYLASVGTGSSDTVDATDDGDYPFFVRSQTPERIGHYSYDTEAVLTAGDGAGVGRVFHHFTGKFEAHQRVYVIQDFVNVKGRYIYYFMSALFGPVVLAGTAKSTVESLRRPMLTDFHIALPPKNEQEAIISFLDSETAKIDAAVDDAREAIALSQERRAALISAAVTGQLDVSQAPSRGSVGEVLEEEVRV